MYLSVYIYIYIFTCVCVCIFVPVRVATAIGLLLRQVVLRRRRVQNKSVYVRKQIP